MAAPEAPAPAAPVPNEAPSGSQTTPRQPGGVLGEGAKPPPDTLEGGLPDPPQPPPQGWTGGMAELDRGYVENKGWKEPGELLASYRALESQMGAGPDGLVRKPKAGADQAEWDAFYTGLGRPASSADYNFDGVEGPAEDIHDLTPQLREWAHKYGLNEEQARGLYGDYNSTIGALQAQVDAERAQQSDIDIAEMKREWGSAYDENLMAGKRFLQRFKISDEVRLQLEDSLGTKAFVSLAAEIGRGLGEHVGPGDVGPDTGRELGFGMTPAAAKQRIKELRSDKEFMQTYSDGNLDARQRFEKLHTVAYPEGPGSL